jgi:uncharacterized membrane protein YkvA (DUF1232 family)
MNEIQDFKQAYSEERFRDKLGRYARSAGREVVEKALLLYYAAQQESVPAWARATIAAALGYFIVPMDAINDLTPAVGYADDLGVLVLAIAAVAAHIDDGVRQKAALKMKRWFGEEEA